MKNIYASFIVLLAMFQFSYAQGWTTAGGKTTTSDSVGIGTTAPTHRLEIAGTYNAGNPVNILKIGTSSFGSNAGDAAGLLFGATGGIDCGRINILAPGSGDMAMNLGVWNGTSVSDILTLKKNGKVGIGTTNPSDIFEVAKTSTSKAKIYTPSAYSYPLDFNTGIIGLALSRYDGIYTEGVYSYSSPTSDNLGIGSRTDIVLLAGNGGLGMQPEVMRIKEGGKVGIGTPSPGNLLEVTSSSMNNTQIAAVSAINNDVFGFRLKNTGTGGQDWHLEQGRSATGSFEIYNGSTAATPLTILPGGFVGINTPSPREALSVNGNIRSKQVKVETANWPDYVFKRNYNLPDLKDVKAYIDQNQHLPDMPSEAEITKDGLNLGELVKTQTKKIEELTLYLIAQNKNAKDQQDQINVLKQQMAVLIKTLTPN